MHGGATLLRQPQVLVADLLPKHRAVRSLCGHSRGQWHGSCLGPIELRQCASLTISARTLCLLARLVEPACQSSSAVIVPSLSVSKCCSTSCRCTGNKERSSFSVFCRVTTFGSMVKAEAR